MDNREEQEFAEMMKQFSIAHGELLIQENERLKADPSAAVPEDVHRRMLNFISNAFDKKQSG